MGVVKKTACDKLVKKVNAIQTIDTSDLSQKADYDTNIGEIEKKILIKINVLLLTFLINFQVQYLMKD